MPHLHSYRDLVDKALAFSMVLVTLSTKPVALKLHHSLAKPIVPGAMGEDEKSFPLPVSAGLCISEEPTALRIAYDAPMVPQSLHSNSVENWGY